LLLRLKNTQIVPDTCVHCVSVQVLGNNFISLSEPELHFKNKKKKNRYAEKVNFCTQKYRKY